MVKPWRQKEFLQFEIIINVLVGSFWLIINPLTAGAAYIRVFIFYYHIKYHFLNMLKIKCDINHSIFGNS